MSWATENEDGNPTLAIINRKTGDFEIHTFAPTLISGGLDDLVFSGPKSKNVYLVASSQTDTTTPVIVQISGKLKKTDTTVTSTLAGAPTTVWNVVTNAAETTDTIGDPDSMTVDPAGELVLDNRSDDSLYIARATGAANSVLRVPLTLAGKAVEVNDTIFTTSATTGAASTAGVIYITDTKANAIYSLTQALFSGERGLYRCQRGWRRRPGGSEQRGGHAGRYRLYGRARIGLLADGSRDSP
jgi:hypothetical protein